MHSARDASEGKGPQRRPQKWLGRRLEEVAKAVGGGYWRLQMQLKPALGVRDTVAGHRLGALFGGGGGGSPLPIPALSSDNSIPGPVTLPLETIAVDSPALMTRRPPGIGG